MNCSTHQIHEIKCSTNINDITVHQHHRDQQQRTSVVVERVFQLSQAGVGADREATVGLDVLPPVLPLLHVVTNLLQRHPGETQVRAYQVNILLVCSNMGDI